jgi:DNA-binding XRE family transcriptional regulator
VHAIIFKLSRRGIRLNPISQLLVIYRKHFELTQKQLVLKLSYLDDEFKGVNTVTISRWETDTTTPNIKKKHKLMSFLFNNGCLESSACREIIRGCYKNLHEPLYQIFSKNYQYIIGNLPEQKGVSDYNFISLKNFKFAKEYIEHIVDIEKASNVKSYYTTTPKELYDLSIEKASFSIICERKKQHLGHFIILKLKNDVAEDIAYHRRSEMSIKTEDICQPYEKGTYYVHAMYGRNPEIAAQLNVKAYLYFLDNIEYIDNIMIFSSRTDGANITKDYGIKLVAKGIDETYNFEWHGMLSPVEDILLSNTVLKLAF